MPQEHHGHRCKGVIFGRRSPRYGVSFPRRVTRHQGLISLATHQRIQERLKEGAKAPCRVDVNEDFPLRGFMLCGECDQPLTACWSTSNTGKKHPYYLCFNRECAAHRKSIRRDEVEGAFEDMLKAITPSEALFKLVGAMFKHAWDQRAAQAEAMAKAAGKELKAIGAQIDRLMDRIAEAENSTVIKAYEKKIDQLEREKLILAEKARSAGKPVHTFEEMFELALSFHASP